MTENMTFDYNPLRTIWMRYPVPHVVLPPTGIDAVKDRKRRKYERMMKRRCPAWGSRIAKMQPRRYEYTSIFTMGLSA